MTSQSNFPKNLNRQVIAQIVLVIIFLAASYLIAIQPNPFETAPPVPSAGTPIHSNATQEKLLATAYQREVEENQDQALGVVFGGTMLVILVIGGTLLVIGKN